MDRPALQLLLSDITAGQVEIVVYKIDRLSAFHDLASPLVSQITAFWVQAIPREV